MQEVSRSRVIFIFHLAYVTYAASTAATAVHVWRRSDAPRHGEGQERVRAAAGTGRHTAAGKARWHGHGSHDGTAEERWWLVLGQLVAVELDAVNVCYNLVTRSRPKLIIPEQVTFEPVIVSAEVYFAQATVFVRPSP